MDLDFENLTGNSTFDPDAEYYLSPYIYTEIPTLIIAIASTIVNVLIIYMVYRFKVLQSRTYNYMVCWCICNFFITTSIPNNFNLFGILERISDEVLCLWNEIMFVFMFGNQIFVAILIVDWYLMTFSSQTSCAVMCRKSQKTIVISVWSLLLVYFVTTITICLLDISFPFSALVSFFSYVLLFVFLLGIFAARCVKLKISSVVVEKTKLELMLVFSYFLCWCPNMICLLIYIFWRRDVIGVHITYMLGYANACVIFILMYIYDPNFKNCLQLLLQRKKEERRQNMDDGDNFEIIIP